MNIFSWILIQKKFYNIKKKKKIFTLFTNDSQINTFLHVQKNFTILKKKFLHIKIITVSF